MNFSFEIPQNFLTQVASNQIQRFGSILKDTTTGKIVAHLQETGATQNIVSKLGGDILLNPFAIPLKTIEISSNIIGNYQIHRLDKKIEQTLELLKGLQTAQYANIALAGLGLGVSVAMFAYTKKRMDKQDMRLSNIQSSINLLVDQQRRIELERLETDLQAQLDLAEEAWLHADGGQRAWTRVADKLNDMVYKYPKHITKELEIQIIEDESLLLYLLERYRVLAATRIECLVLTGELQAAFNFSKKFSEQNERLLSNISPLKFTSRDNSSAPKFQSNLQKGRALSSRIQDFKDTSLTRNLLISDFIDNKTDGREYIKQLKQEKSRELVLVSF